MNVRNCVLLDSIRKHLGKKLCEVGVVHCKRKFNVSVECLCHSYVGFVRAALILSFLLELVTSVASLCFSLLILTSRASRRG